MRKIFFSVLCLVVIASAAAVPLLAGAENNGSQACPPDGSNLLNVDTICNPEPRFYFDLGHDKNTFPGLLAFIIDQLLLIVGILSVLFLIIGGFKYVTSAGNQEQAESSKRTITNAIIGLVVVIMSYVIVTVVINALAGKVR